jgi:hypothetical protein
VYPTHDVQPLIAASLDPAKALFEKTWMQGNIERGRQRSNHLQRTRIANEGQSLNPRRVRVRHCSGSRRMRDSRAAQDEDDHADPARIETPNKLETHLGTLTFFDGAPDKETTQKVYDDLDLRRATEAFLTALPIASMSAMETGLRKFGPPNTTAMLFENLIDSRSVWLTPNAVSIYQVAWVELGNEPMVPTTSTSARGTQGDREQLDPERPRQRLEHDLPALWPARAVLRQDLEAERSGLGGVEPDNRGRSRGAWAAAARPHSAL